MKARALIVEDRAEIANMYALALENIELEVFIAFNLTDAYEILRKIPPPDIVFLDLGLSLKENAEFTVRQIAHIKSFNPDMTVIVVSGLLTPELVEVATLQGAAAVRTKMNMIRQVDTWNTVEEALSNATTTAKGRLAGPLELIRRLSHSMKVVSFLCCIPFLSGCAEVCDKNGNVLMRITGNAKWVRYTQTPKSTTFEMTDFDPAKVHKTIGINVMQSAASIGTAVATSGVIK